LRVIVSSNARASRARSASARVDTLSASAVIDWAARFFPEARLAAAFSFVSPPTTGAAGLILVGSPRLRTAAVELRLAARVFVVHVAVFAMVPPALRGVTYLEGTSCLDRGTWC
jgi:hypothetical protein